MDASGDGWVRCAAGHRHWGRFGAAGLLVHTVDDTGVVRLLLQRRAMWSHFGGTWGLVGGARNHREDATAAALREAREEAGLNGAAITVRHTFIDDHGGWSYTTVYADTPEPLPTRRQRESAALEWVALTEVDRLPLHPGLAATWPQLRPRPVVLLVDAANVVGARADGWWRDRSGAAARLLAELAQLRATITKVPGLGTAVVAGATAVLEGAATTAPAPAWVSAVRTPRSSGLTGDDRLVKAAEGLVASGRTLVVVTADRGLRERVHELVAPAGDPSAVHIVGPRWLLSVLPTGTPTTEGR